MCEHIHTMKSYSCLILEMMYTMYFAESRLDDFLVEASDNILPEGVEYDAVIVNGRLCAQFPGRPPPKPTELVCTSEAIGRYVYVHIPYDDKMTICEIEVYGKIRTYGSYVRGKLVTHLKKQKNILASLKTTSQVSHAFIECQFEEIFIDNSIRTASFKAL